MPEACRARTLALDISTLFVVATWCDRAARLSCCSHGMQERCARCVVGSRLSDRRLSARLGASRADSPPLPAGIANALLFIACGIIWNAARLFHGAPSCGGRWLPGDQLAVRLPAHDFASGRRAIVLSSLSCPCTRS